MPDTARLGARERAVAILSLVAVVLLAAVLVGFLVRNGVYVVVGLAGLVLAVAGGWWVDHRSARRGGRRVIGMVVGAAVLVVGVAPGRERGLGILRPIRSSLCALLAIAVHGGPGLASLDAGLRTSAPQTGCTT